MNWIQIVRKKQIKAAIILVISVNILFSTVYNSSSIDSDEGYFFTLVAKTNFGGIRPDYLNLVKQQLERIRIKVDVIPMWYGGFLYDLIAYRDFDMCYLGLSGGGADPDFTGVYDENGSLNLFGYHTSMDYNETLGTGLNEWYMKHGTLINPPNSDERIQHYWDWQDYLMDEILPCLPTFAPKTYDTYWGTLTGYNSSKGILQSWGNMSWESEHMGQQNTDEFVIADSFWSDQNPLFQDDSSSAFISRCTMDPLLYFDSNNKFWPHLAESYTFLNDTHLRIKTREGIQWQDYDGFSSEKFDAKDVYFTIYSWKEVSSDQRLWEWLEDIELIDNTTIDIYIDGDPNTQENEPYAPTLASLCQLILPEHYLNQTQIADGVTPDIRDDSWNRYATNAFGTGLFELSSFTAGVETELTVFDNCWWLNDSITEDTNLDWTNRFGNFSNIIDILRIKVLNNYVEQQPMFLAGEIDFYQTNDINSLLYNSQGNEHIDYQEQVSYYFGFLGFNMRSVREHIGNPDLCEDDASITKGLAIRKAICYAIDRNEINDIVNGGQYQIINHPIYERMGIWCSPNIIKYNHDLELAKYYMGLAGFDVPDHIYGLQENSSLWIYLVAGISYVTGVGVLIFSSVLIKRRRGVKQKEGVKA